MVQLVPEKSLDFLKQHNNTFVFLDHYNLFKKNHKQKEKYEENYFKVFILKLENVLFQGSTNLFFLIFFVLAYKTIDA